MDTDEGLYHATPQTKGRIAHDSIDAKKASNRADDLQSLAVMSEEFGLMGKIDIYKGKERKLIERKYQLRNIYQGQIYQLWAQYLCMKEMAYDIESLAFYEISTNKMIPIEIPSDRQIEEFKRFLDTYRNYDPSQPLLVNENKCKHCVYCNLCDKMNGENVYQ